MKEHWLLLIDDKVCWHPTEPGEPARPVVLGSPDEVMAYAKATYNVGDKALRARKVTPAPGAPTPVAPGWLEHDGRGFTVLDEPSDAALSAWERIMLAAKNGTGCHLDAEACFRLSRDGAVEERARLDSEARIRGCAHWWHEEAEPYETRCPACGKDE